ncbi:hypothetical protein HN873_022349, partial [Arachis hypogaea]
ASFSDHQSIVDAVKKVDVVISAISGVHIRSHSIGLQLNLINAIKEAGNVKRFLPSEFGLESLRMGDALEPRTVTFEDKIVVRKAIEEANIPFTYISANLFASYFAGSLSQLGSFVPPRKKVHLFGDGTLKAIFVDEDDASEDKSFGCIKQEDDVNGKVGVTLSKEKDLMTIAGDALKTNITTLSPLVLPTSEQLRFFATLVAKKLLKTKVNIF